MSDGVHNGCVENVHYVCICPCSWLGLERNIRAGYCRLLRSLGFLSLRRAPLSNVSKKRLAVGNLDHLASSLALDAHAVVLARSNLCDGG